MIVLTGPSASGKTEVAKLLIYKYKVQKVVTHTTRAMRPGEIADIDYHFVTKQKFLDLVKKNYFVEWTLYNNNYYGTSKEEIDEDKAVIVDPNGVSAFQALGDKNVIIFRLTATETTRFNRMMIRGDSLDNIKRRLHHDKECFSEDKYRGVDYTIDTEHVTIEAVADEVYALYRQAVDKAQREKSSEPSIGSLDL